jgi:hypothetical protein
MNVPIKSTATGTTVTEKAVRATITNIGQRHRPRLVGLVPKPRPVTVR